MATPASDHTTRGEAAPATVRVGGELDLANCTDLESAIESALASADEVTVDLTAVTFIDSSAVHVLLRAKRRHGERVRVGATSPPVDRVLEVAGVRDLLR